jgi:hypothetical protein
MSSSAELHLSYRLGNAPIQPYPYPHCYLEEAFPPDYFARLRSLLPDPAALLPLEQARGVKGYDERFVLEFKEEQFARLTREQDAFWRELHGWLVGGRFLQLMLAKFAPYLQQRFQGREDARFHDEALLVQDTVNYKLGPHTDAPRKVLTLLFYLPGDLSQQHMGTSMYVPRERDFRCPGGPHHPHANFDRVWTQPFLPNSAFVFLKTDRSFHGVEPVVDAGTRRWLLLYDIYEKK